jgi:hypothetical protein
MKFILLLLIAFNSFAQLRPSQSQYLDEKGALINPGFEQGVKGWTITGGCSPTVTSDIPYLNKSFFADCAVNAFILTQDTTNLAPFEGQAAVLELQYKADDDAVVNLRANGVDEVSLNLLPTDGKYKKVKIPFVVNGTSNGVSFESGLTSGDFYIDDVSLKLGGIEQKVSEAHFVGSSYSSVANCIYLQNYSGSGWDVFNADADCTYIITGQVSEPDTKIPGVKINNVRTDGYYKVDAFARYRSVTATDSCTFSLSSGVDYESQPVSDVNSNNDERNHYLSGNFRFSDSADKTIQVIFQGIDSGTQCEINSDATRNRNTTFIVHFFPDSQSTIVSQNTELTAETANEFSTFIGGGTGTTSPRPVSRENFNWIDGDCTRNAIGDYDCDFIGDLFVSTPNCNAIVEADNTHGVSINSVSTSGISLRVYNIADGNARDNDISLFCQRSTDYNKSATIIVYKIDQHLKL